MALVRWDPFAELDNLHRQVNAMFNDTFSGLQATNRMMPATDVYSDEKGLTIEAQLPNFKEDEISVNEHEGALEIKAEHQEKQEEKDKKRKYLVRESVSSYYRRFELPKNSDAGKISAHFENGVLKINVPYKKLPEPKRIAIKAKNK